MKRKKSNLEKKRFRKYHLNFKSITSKVTVNYLIAFAFFLIIWYLSFPGVFTCRIELKEGSVVQKDIFSPVSFWVEDREATKEVEELKIAKFYRPTCDFNLQIREETLAALFDFIDKKELPLKLKERNKKELKTKYPQYILSSDFRKSVRKAEQKNIFVRKEELPRQKLDVNEIKSLDEVKETILAFLSRELKLTSKEKEFIEDKFSPTLIYNSAVSGNFRQELIDAVHPREKLITQGENIVRIGDKITAQQTLNLNALNKFLAETNFKKRIFGVGLLTLIVLALVTACLYILPYDFNLLNRYLVVIGIISVGLLFLSKSFVDWFPAVFIPVASGAILVTLLLSVPLAIAFALFASIMVSNSVGGEFGLLLMFLLGSLSGILAVKRIRQRLDLFKAIIPIGLVNTGVILSMGLIRTLGFSEIGKQIVWGWGNSFLCVGIAAGVSPIFESFFKITSDINLLELSDLNRPILRRLMIEASGTYHHSLIVGNLAEAAAERIKANSLLARVGSYYHDIGKLYKCEYFSENQAKSKSRHENLTPKMSSLVIAGHVKEGTALAGECKLPRLLIDFIEQHHGTTLMWIFYQAALEQKGADEIKEDDFRYPGPKPQTREIAIVMLADAVEAASRSLDEPTPARIRSLVERIINDKFLDAQLEECNLTLGGLHEIAESFIYTLTGLFHVRVEYPQGEKRNNGRRNKKKGGKNPVSLSEGNHPGNFKKIGS